jgi:hypothetical protein
MFIQPAFHCYCHVVSKDLPAQTNHVREYGFETIADMETAVKQWLVELDTDFCGYGVHELTVQYQSPRGLCRNMVYESYSDEFEVSFMNHKFYILVTPLISLEN